MPGSAQRRYGSRSQEISGPGEAEFQEAIRVLPNYGEPHVANAWQPSRMEAVRVRLHTSSIRPFISIRRTPPPVSNYGSMLNGMQRFRSAPVQLEEVLKPIRTSPRHDLLGTILERKGMTDEAKHIAT